MRQRFFFFFFPFFSLFPLNLQKHCIIGIFVLKKKLQREGVFREMKLKQHFEKPSEKKAREKAEAIRRARKLARKKAQREGML